MDTVFIQGLEVQACVGVPDEERAHPQRVLMDLKLELDLKEAGKQDWVEATVDYAAVAEGVKRLVEGRSFRLVEAIAESVAELLISRFNVARVSVKVRKFSVSGTKSVGVQLVREGKVNR